MHRSILGSRSNLFGAGECAPRRNDNRLINHLTVNLYGARIVAGGGLDDTLGGGHLVVCRTEGGVDWGNLRGMDRRFTGEAESPRLK